MIKQIGEINVKSLKELEHDSEIHEPSTVYCIPNPTPGSLAEEVANPKKINNTQRRASRNPEEPNEETKVVRAGKEKPALLSDFSSQRP